MVQKYEVGDCVYALMNGIARAAIVREVVYKSYHVFYRIEAAGIWHDPLVSDSILYSTAWQAHEANASFERTRGWTFVGDGGITYDTWHEAKRQQASRGTDVL